MTNNNNIEKKDKRTEPLTAEELQALKDLAAQAPSFSTFAVSARIERMILANAIMRGSAAPESVKKIRKFLQRQTAAA